MSYDLLNLLNNYEHERTKITEAVRFLYKENTYEFLNNYLYLFCVNIYINCNYVSCIIEDWKGNCKLCKVCEKFEISTYPYRGIPELYDLFDYKIVCKYGIII